METSDLVLNCWLALARICKEVKDEVKKDDCAFVRGKLAGICLAMQTFGTTVENAEDPVNANRH